MLNVKLMPCNSREMSIYHYLAQQTGKLEELAMERLRQHAKNEGTLLRFQLLRFGVCPCDCHTGPLVHASRPCCVQARMKSTWDEECSPAGRLRQEGRSD
jgi:hypothetical protein